MVAKKKVSKKKASKKNINRSKKGKRREYLCRDQLRAQGYNAELSSASRGPYDVYAHNADEFVLVQVKCNWWPSRGEMSALRRIKVPSCARKLVYVYMDGCPKEPKIREL